MNSFVFNSYFIYYNFNVLKQLYCLFPMSKNNIFDRVRSKIESKKYRICS